MASYHKNLNDKRRAKLFRPKVLVVADHLKRSASIAIDMGLDREAFCEVAGDVFDKVEMEPIDR
jgi:hypothetical protein